MLRDFIMNVSLLITSLFIIGQLLQNIRALPNVLLSKACIGSLFGLQGVLLMVFTIHPAPGVIVDLRHLAIVVATVYAGPAAALVSSVMIALARIMLFGLSPSSLIGAIGMLAIGGVCAALSPLRGNRFTLFFVMNTVSLLICSIVIAKNSPDWQTAAHILTYHWPVSFFGGFAMLYITQYMHRTYQHGMKLARSEHQHRQLLENSPDAMIVHSGGAIRFINEKGAQLLGARQLHELTGRAVSDFLHVPLHPFPNVGLFPAPAPEPKEPADYTPARQRLVRLDGHVLDVEVAASAIVYDEEPAVLATFRDMTAQKQTEQKLRNALEKLNQLSVQDGLTGIANRQAFDRKLEHMWQESYANCKRISLIRFDIDNFKHYNDMYGHLAGDECLQAIATAAQSMLTGSDRFIARYGGDGFAVILPETGKDTACGIAESIRKKIDSLCIAHSGADGGERVTVSLGVGFALPNTPHKFEELVHAADKALCKAKTDGRNLVVIWK